MIVIKCEGYLEATEKFPDTDEGNEASIRYLQQVEKYQDEQHPDYRKPLSTIKPLKIAITHE